RRAARTSSTVARVTPIGATRTCSEWTSSVRLSVPRSSTLSSTVSMWADRSSAIGCISSSRRSFRSAPPPQPGPTTSALSRPARPPRSFNSTTAQLYSNFTDGMSNELIVGYSTIHDERQVPVQAPEVGVGVNTGGTPNAVTFGTEQFSPGNLLDQKIFEAVDNVTIPKGAHTLTVGGRLDFTHIFNNFAQGSYGVYTFQTIAALEARTPSGYAVGYANSQNPSDIPADFHVRV